MAGHLSVGCLSGAVGSSTRARDTAQGGEPGAGQQASGDSRVQSGAQVFEERTCGQGLWDQRTRLHPGMTVCRGPWNWFKSRLCPLVVVCVILEKLF